MCPKRPFKGTTPPLPQTLGPGEWQIHEKWRLGDNGLLTAWKTNQRRRSEISGPNEAKEEPRCPAAAFLAEDGRPVKSKTDPL
jgi:hypothetical protein